MGPGSAFASPRFRAAGVTGYLRFWPAGYWTENQRRKHTLEQKPRDGGAAPPSSDAWCCIGVCFPSCTHLCLRFFVADAKSEVLQCYWSEGVHMSSIWGPPIKDPPPELTHGGSLVVGIEILQNRGDPHGRPANRHAKLKHLDYGVRHGERPLYRPKMQSSKSKSTPSLAGGGEFDSEPDCVLLGHSQRPVKSKSLRPLSRAPSRPLSPNLLGPPTQTQTKPLPADYPLDKVAAWALDEGPRTRSHTLEDGTEVSPHLVRRLSYDGPELTCPRGRYGSDEVNDRPGSSSKFSLRFHKPLRMMPRVLAKGARPS